MTRPLSNINLALNRGDGVFGEAFSPSDIANLTAWWDPDDGDTVTLSGANITALTDKAGPTAGLTLVQRGAVAQLEAATEVGRTWMSAQTTDQMLQTTTANTAEVLPGTGEFSIYIVIKPNFVGSGTSYALFQKGFTGWYGLRSNSATSSNVVGYVDDVGGAGFRTAQSGANEITRGGRHIIRLVRDNTSNLLRVYVDGTQVSSADITGMGTADDAAEQFTLGARASGASQTDFFDGMIGEVLFYKDVLSAGDNTNLESYLATKWSTVGATTFTPSDIETLTFHLDPSLETDDDGTDVNITDLEGGVVMSSNQSTNAGLPTLTTIGSQKWMEFLGAEMLQNTSAVAAGINFGNAPFAIAVVVRPHDITVGRERLLNKGVGTTGRYAMDYNEAIAGDVRGILQDGTNTDTLLDTTGGRFAANEKIVFWLVRHDQDGNVYLYVNNTLVETDALSVGDIDESSTNPNSHYLSIGAGPATITTATSFLDADVGEVLFFKNTELSDNVRGLVDTYLATKWGV